MTGLCSIHRKPDPGCALCAARPRDLIPDWEERLKAAQAAGMVKCLGCGFEFFRTAPACPKCSWRAKPETLITVSACHPALATEVMWFINEWCRESGWLAPRINSSSEQTFTIYAYPPSTPGAA